MILRCVLFVTTVLGTLVMPKFIIDIFGKHVCWFCLYLLNIRPLCETADKIDNRARIIVFQHHTYIDNALIGYVFGMTGFVMKESLMRCILPWFYVMKYPCILVGRGGCTERLLQFMQRKTGKVAIPPEGGSWTPQTCTGILAQFRTGAFVQLMPVQPVTFRFSDQSIEWRTNESAVHWYIRQFKRNYTISVVIHVHSSVSPDLGSSPQQFADKTKMQMLRDHFESKQSVE